MKLEDISPRTITITAIILIVGLIAMLIVGILLIREPELMPAVASTIPQDNEEGVLGILPLEITFQEELDGAVQSDVAVVINPETDSSATWSSANTLQVTIDQGLESATTYTVAVLYKQKEIYSFSFKTTDKAKEQIEEEARQQAADDFLVAEAEKDFYKTYPWYASIPIETNEYVIVYNFEKEAFRIRLTLGENALGAEVEAAKNRALGDLEAIGVDLNEYSYYFLID
ncbi:hypothetical protein GTO10_01995 [Candidatus Saccharibacteria bacterium]|nr:hypothetical protein [Candidatus Saccharibacteria bacterium]